MKSLNFIFASLLLILTISITSCGGSTSTSESSEQDSVEIVDKSTEKNTETTNISESDSTTNKSSKTIDIEHTAKYICPNHCKGSGSDKAGVCKNSECEMDLMENPNYKEDNM